MTSKKGLDFIKEISKHAKGMKLYDRVMDKVKIVSAGEGKCTAEFTIEEEHTNMRGALHGGFSATLVNCISSYAMWTYDQKVSGVSLDMHITYMKPAYLGDEILVEANAVKTGRTLGFLNVCIKNKKTRDTLVTGSHTALMGLSS